MVRQKRSSEMLKSLRLTAFALAAMVLSSTVAAQGFDLRRLFFGAGFSANTVPGSDDGAGFQAFGGYNFPAIASKLYVDAEAGYMDTGKLEVRCPQGVCDAKKKGPWANGVLRYLVTPSVELIGRAGVDFGDDDGLMVGIGAGYIANTRVKVRVEFVQRDDVTSVQFNVVLYPW
jgi:hypothetical protein